MGYGYYCCCGCTAPKSSWKVRFLPETIVHPSWNYVRLIIPKGSTTDFKQCGIFFGSPNRQYHLVRSSTDLTLFERKNRLDGINVTLRVSSPLSSNYCPPATPTQFAYPISLRYEKGSEFIQVDYSDPDINGQQTPTITNSCDICLPTAAPSASNTGYGLTPRHIILDELNPGAKFQVAVSGTTGINPSFNTCCNGLNTTYNIPLDIPNLSFFSFDDVSVANSYNGNQGNTSIQFFLRQGTCCGFSAGSPINSVFFQAFNSTSFCDVVVDKGCLLNKDATSNVWPSLPVDYALTGACNIAGASIQITESF